MTQFKVGDRVFCNTDGTWHAKTLNGATGTVISASRDPDGYPKVRWDNNVWPAPCVINPKCLTLISKEEIKVGDKVICTSDFHHHKQAKDRLKGTVGKVTRIAPRNGVYGPTATIKYPPGVWPGDGKWYDIEPTLALDTLIKVKEEDMPAEEDDLQIKVFNYLRGHGISHERKTALKDLVDRGFFALGKSRVDALSILEAYLEHNPAKFCSSGIKRFRDALDIQEPKNDRSPLHPDALVLDELKYGDVFVYQDVAGGRSGYHGKKFVFLGEVQKNNSDYTAFKAVELNCNGSKTSPTKIYAADRGLEPYSRSGHSVEWSASIYCIRGDV